MTVERNNPRWGNWPQEFAPNVAQWIRPRSKQYPVRGMHLILLRAAQMLAARFTPALHIGEVVVFYPRHLRDHIGRNLRNARMANKLDPFKGLTICATPRLRDFCMAFRIADVEAHRTPADSYHVDVRASGKRRGLEPAPLYTAEENAGKELHE